MINWLICAGFLLGLLSEFLILGDCLDKSLEFFWQGFSEVVYHFLLPRVEREPTHRKDRLNNPQIINVGNSIANSEMGSSCSSRKAAMQQGGW